MITMIMTMTMTDGDSDYDDNNNVDDDNDDDYDNDYRNGDDNNNDDDDDNDVDGYTKTVPPVVHGMIHAPRSGLKQSYRLQLNELTDSLRSGGPLTPRALDVLQPLRMGRRADSTKLEIDTVCYFTFAPKYKQDTEEEEEEEGGGGGEEILVTYVQLANLHTQGVMRGSKTKMTFTVTGASKFLEHSVMQFLAAEGVSPI
ncbi:hypothetical protein ANN_10106 [Periplaneta americana]|uniref:Uncharacterized protein n=1 Tax=Periplaneta americana TaxID=6978 RepID=A0ABQ8TNG9_PERAM|nr:hypothetical protein ANN_10106 [Periplaneta americana]